MRNAKFKEQLERLNRGSVQVIPEDELARRLSAALRSRTPLRVKYGADPSAPDIHLGHTVPLQKLGEFQDGGHRVIFIIGDFTALVGDPSGVSQTRLRLSREEVIKNSRTYQEQVFKILDPARTEVVYNSTWLAALKFPDVIELAGKYTVARMLERDDFRKRYREGQPISILEFLYPLMQGYDSVAVHADVEVGGTDQTFNLLVAREIQREYGQMPQVILTMPLLEGTDGVQKMSKSLNNYIGIAEPAKDIYGKIMSISDDLMWRYYELLSKRTPDEIDAAKQSCRSGTNPMIWKKSLAYEITERFTSSREAEAASRHFEQLHQKKQVPDDIEILNFSCADWRQGRGKISLVEKLVEIGWVQSRSEARRKIAEGAVRLNGKKIPLPATPTDPCTRVVRVNEVLSLGKRRVGKIS